MKTDEWCPVFRGGNTGSVGAPRQTGQGFDSYAQHPGDHSGWLTSLVNR